MQRWMIALVLGVLGAACDGSANACDVVEGRTFLSVDERECGLTPDGPAMCHWRLQFSDGEYSWSYSDVSESGTYTCDGDTLDASGGGGASYRGTVESDPDRLTWDGVTYEPAP